MGKCREVLFSVLPIVAIVFLLQLVVPMSSTVNARFALGAVFVFVGLSVFLFGVDIGITPLGQHIGGALSKSNRIIVLVAVGLVLGFFVSIAEPDLMILADQVETVTGGGVTKLAVLVCVSIGIGAMLVLGLIRIVFNFPLYKALMIAYGVIFVIALFSTSEFLAIAFDASGATTGALTVPFILALAIGISAMKRDSKASEKDSFGLVGLSSTGAILGVLVMGLFSKSIGPVSSLPASEIASTSVLLPFARTLPTILVESFVALLPIVAIALVFMIRSFSFGRRQMRRLLKGLVYTYIGLALFLTGVNAGFMEIGVALGERIAHLNNPGLAVGVAFVIGLATILAEPAVHVLTRQIEEVTSGYVQSWTVLAALSLGVGLAVALSILRVLVPQIQLWHYLLPGFAISLALSFVAPKLFVGMAFDAGGVASGPMTATFILAFAQGIASAVAGADVLRDAFGLIAVVAMTPIIALQILGLFYKLKSRRKGGEAQVG